MSLQFYLLCGNRLILSHYKLQIQNDYVHPIIQIRMSVREVVKCAEVSFFQCVIFFWDGTRRACSLYLWIGGGHSATN